MVFIAVALLMPRALAPLRRLWLKLGHLMSIVVSPIILAVMYVLAIVVTGVLIRLFGKDLLSLKREPAESVVLDKTKPARPRAQIARGPVLTGIGARGVGGRKCRAW